MAGGKTPHSLTKLIAGLDEAGRGCLAGPVVAAAVILPRNYDLPGLKCSKKISVLGRSRLAQSIREQAVSWSLGLSWPREIEVVNILQASLLAMCRAVHGLRTIPDALIVDGPHLVPLDILQQAMVRADSLVPEVCAASILAKCFRDRLMSFLDRRYPGYGLARHKGYPTTAHLEALRRLGPSQMHRRTFRGVIPDRGRLCLPGI
jgi:ribonuclease HII